MEGKFSVYFENPFWVGIYERQDDEGYSVARVVFGSEPTEAVLYEFILKNYKQFKFSRANVNEKVDSKQKNYKRAQREARQAMRIEGVGTKAQEALKLALAENKRERREHSRVERKQEADELFRLRQQKKQEKHRGH